MLGALARERRGYEQAMFGAWQGVRFTRTERLKAFSKYAAELKPAEPPQRQSAAMRLSVFEGMRAAGVPVKITRRD